MVPGVGVYKIERVLTVTWYRIVHGLPFGKDLQLPEPPWPNVSELENDGILGSK